MAVRAVRGAIQVDADERQQLLDATTELLQTVPDRNGLGQEDLISVVFTATPVLTSEFPAYAARQLGFVDVPLMCATEISVAGAMPRVVRLLAHAAGLHNVSQIAADDGRGKGTALYAIDLAK